MPDVEHYTPLRVDSYRSYCEYTALTMYTSNELKSTTSDTKCTPANPLDRLNFCTRYKDEAPL